MPASSQQKIQKLDNKLLEIAVKAEKSIISVVNEQIPHKDKEKYFNQIKSYIKIDLAREISEVFSEEKLNLKLLYSSSKSAFILENLNSSMEITHNLGKNGNLSAQEIENLSSNNLFINSKKRLENVQVELNNQLSTMNTQIDEMVDRYSKQNFKKHFVGATSICLAIIMSLLGIATFALLTAGLGIALSASIAGANSVLAGTMLGMISYPQVTIAILNLSQVIGGSIVSAIIAGAGLVTGGIYDLINVNKNKPIEKKLQKESRILVEGLSSIGHNLLEMSNIIVSHSIDKSNHYDKTTKKHAVITPKAQNTQQGFVSMLNDKQKIDKNMPFSRSSL